VLAEGQSVLVPSKALAELNRALGSADQITLRLGERDASFDVGTTRLTTRLIEGEFPNYRGLIPSSYPNRLTVGREPLLDAVRRVRLMAREATPIRLNMRPDGLELVAITQDVGQAHEELDAKYEGSELTVAFNPEYLLNGVEVTPGDEVVIESLDALKPAVVRSTEGSDFLYLLMPVRVS
jgi:DNA polymerase III subunit beta